MTIYDVLGTVRVFLQKCKVYKSMRIRHEKYIRISSICDNQVSTYLQIKHPYFSLPKKLTVTIAGNQQNDNT